MKQPPLLKFLYLGDSSTEHLQEIRSKLEECYSRLNRRVPKRVEVQVFETSAELNAFLEKEKAKFGITTQGDEAFICSHDAWQGYPRLLICRERLFSFPPTTRLGVLRHEVAHTVLHGNPIYYTFPIPQEYQELALVRGLNRTVLQQMLYYCAIAVKDFEATRLLLRLGYQECQVAFAETQFLSSNDDKLAWLLAKDHPQAKWLFFTAQLKTLLPGWLLDVAGLIQLDKSADSMLHYMGSEVRKQFLGLAISIAKQLGGNTHKNVRLTLGQVLQQPWTMDKVPNKK